MSVPRLGPKAFEQCAGFLRIPDADDPLDRSAVHPEAYPVVRRMLTRTGLDVGSLVGNSPVLASLDPAAFIDGSFGLPTMNDILTELEKPGWDPRPAFTTAPPAARPVGPARGAEGPRRGAPPPDSAIADALRRADYRPD